jgi:hypothetical protein
MGLGLKIPESDPQLLVTEHQENSIVATSITDSAVMAVTSLDTFSHTKLPMVRISRARANAISQVI